MFAREAVTDMLFSVLLAGSLPTYFLAETEERSFVPFWLLAAVATLTKGPVAIVLCGFVALGHVTVRGSCRSLVVAASGSGGRPENIAEDRQPGCVHLHRFRS